VGKSASGSALKKEQVGDAKARMIPSGTILTRIVGEVGERFVTSREVRINDAIEQALNAKPSDPATGFAVASLQDKEFASRVAVVLDEWAMYMEAILLSSEGVSKSEVMRLQQLVLERWSSDSQWKQMDVVEQELREILERKLVARDFIRLKADPQMAPISDAEALLYYKKHRLRFGSLPFESFKENIKSFLTKQQVERRLSEWREVLRRRYRVRNLTLG
jgi:hypothetical protein